MEIDSNTFLKKKTQRSNKVDENLSVIKDLEFFVLIDENINLNICEKNNENQNFNCLCKDCTINENFKAFNDEKPSMLYAKISKNVNINLK